MLNLTGKNIAYIFRRALNLIDYRLVDHGERVAYIVLKMLIEKGGYSDKKLAEICLLCLLHDIGAFKTEKIDSLTDAENLFSFELKETFGHSAYGYLFLENFHVLGEYSDAILYHHFTYEKLIHTDCVNKALAAKIYLADRADILFIKNRLIINDELFAGLKNTVFSAEDVELLIRTQLNHDITNNLNNGKYLTELFGFLDEISFSYEHMLAFMRLLAYSIDFRSKFTVMHTITTVGLSVEIARLLGVSGDSLNKILFGSLLHDIGKIASSIMVLEKNEKLDDFEYNMMKDHVVASERIIEGLISDDIVKIAVRHHEKLDGTGYPYGLKSDDLNENERIVAVADILSALAGKRSYKDSFPEEKIRSILEDMANSGKLCVKVVGAVLDNYSSVINNAMLSCKDALFQYEQLEERYISLVNSVKFVV